MKRTLQGLLVLTLAVVLAMPAMAAEEKKKNSEKKPENKEKSEAKMSHHLRKTPTCVSRTNDRVERCVS